jgi:hypothetical protein
MLLQSDVFGFPMVSMPGVDLSVSLLPVTKFQFERFIAQENPYSDSWYDEILAVNPRCSWRRIDEKNREGLFITGILPSEALDFAAWMGNGFDLPHAWEWRQIFETMARTRVGADPLQGFSGNPAAESIIDSLVTQVKPNNWAEMSLLRGGLMEWVRNGEVFGGFGVPRQEFLPNSFNPEVDEPRRPLPTERSRYFGFRLVCRPPTAVHRVTS